MVYPIISSQQIREISSAILQGKQNIRLSLDLGFSGETMTIPIFSEGIIVDGQKVSLPKIRDDDKSCYLIIGGVVEKVQYYSDKIIYKLVPTKARPILQLSGTSMHKQKFIERIERDKLSGNVLDSGTGLGYSAIVASKTANKVYTIEIDPMILELQKINPYSQELFNDKKIEVIKGDMVDKIGDFKPNFFNFAIMDGGTPRSSGEFFSLKNYQNVFKVLKRGGRLYHYVPNYHINKGIDFAENISRLLERAGFTRIEKNKEGDYLIVKK